MNSQSISFLREDWTNPLTAAWLDAGVCARRLVPTRGFKDGLLEYVPEPCTLAPARDCDPDRRRFLHTCGDDLPLRDDERRILFIFDGNGHEDGRLQIDLGGP